MLIKKLKLENVINVVKLSYFFFNILFYILSIIDYFSLLQYFFFIDSKDIKIYKY